MKNSANARKVVALWRRRTNGYVIGPGGLQEPGGKTLTLMKGAIYFMGASSSPQMIAVTSVSDDVIKYKAYPFNGKELRQQRWIGADLIERGTRTALRTRGKYMEPELKRSLESMLSGGKGRVENLKDYEPVTVIVRPTNDEKYDSDANWRAAEFYGNVGGQWEEEVLEIGTERRQVDKIKNDSRFEVVKVTTR